MPKKSKFRMHAHINPFGALTWPVPQNTKFVDWSLHYPAFFGLENNNEGKIVTNTGKYPLNYDDKPTHGLPKAPTILDIGCGYGGLCFALAPHFPNDLILGMEIRDKVVNFVGEKIRSLRINSGHKEMNNVAAVRTNCMKTFSNYFEKDSVEKIFFCFADPHFKKSNHRRRIINTALITDYAYTLKPGGKIYTVTDVKDLHDWQVEKMSSHPMFEMLPIDMDDLEICEKIMREGTDEA